VNTDDLHRSMPLCATLEMHLVSAAKDEVVLTMDWSATRTTTAGLLHGGAVMALADSAGGVCAFLNVPEGAGTSTIESKTNFLGAVKDGTITATARPLHVGGTTIVVETEIRRGDGKLVGKVTQTQAVLKR
jgi:1,4-dihydroxy-2-naphthoyl-CoA hydrolase